MYTSQIDSADYFFPFILLIVGLVILDVVVRGFALWRAGRNNQSRWFIALFIFNTVGILPAIYLIFFQRQSASKTK